jgi:hypothetical protein
MLLLSVHVASLVPAVYCETLSWSTRGSLNISRSGQCGSSVHLVPFGSSLYAFGGESLQGNVFRSNNFGITWAKIASKAFSPSRDCFATAVTRFRMHVLGGGSCYVQGGFNRCQTGTHFSSADGITFVSETSFPDPSTAAFFTAVGVTINDVDYVYTSASGCCPYTNTVRRYNTVSKTWQTTKSITYDSSGNNYGTRATTQIKATADGTLYLAGGDNQAAGYKQARDLWVSRDYGFTWNKCSLSISTGFGPAIVANDNVLYIFNQNNLWSTNDRGYTFTSWAQTLDGIPLPSTFDSTTSDLYAVHNGHVFLVKGGGQNDAKIISTLAPTTEELLEAPPVPLSATPTAASVRYSLSFILSSIQPGDCPRFRLVLAPFVRLLCLLNLNLSNHRPGLCNRMGSRFALIRGGSSHRVHAAVCL